eukprot:1186850-Prorocentrum_minimum.AAC.1
MATKVHYDWVAGLILGRQINASLCTGRRIDAHRVLAEHDFVRGEGGDAAEHFEFFVADVVRAEARGALHRNQRHDLQQVVLDDVADDAVVVKVPPPALYADGLLENDLRYAGVTKASQRRYAGVTVMLQRCHRGVARVVLDRAHA